jgi:DNA-binding transcriptional MerR regulator
MSTDTSNDGRLFYSIGDVAKMFGENISTIRYWENEFDILKPKKNKKGNRLFTQTDLKNIEIIRYLLRDQGMTLKGAKTKLKEQSEGLEQNAEIARRLKEVRKSLTGLMQLLEPEKSDY